MFTQDGAGRGRLTGTTDRQGNTEALTYSGSGALFPHLTGITDQAGQHVAVSDSEGRISSFTRPDGAVWRIGYSSVVASSNAHSRVTDRLDRLVVSTRLSTAPRRRRHRRTLNRRSKLVPN